jgi:hypothetical protein
MTGLAPPTNIRNTFGVWVQNMNHSKRKLLFVGIGAMLWKVWLSRNDIVFNKSPTLSYMQVIYRGTHWARTWALFQKVEDRGLLLYACRALETLTMKIFAKHK